MTNLHEKLKQPTRATEIERLEIEIRRLMRETNQLTDDLAEGRNGYSSTISALRRNLELTKRSRAAFLATFFDEPNRLPFLDRFVDPERTFLLSLFSSAGVNAEELFREVGERVLACVGGFETVGQLQDRPTRVQVLMKASEQSIARGVRELIRVLEPVELERLVLNMDPWRSSR